MISQKKNALLITLLLLLLVGSGTWFYGPRFFAGAKAPASAPLPPYHSTALGPYTVKGNTILGKDGKPYLFYGVGRDGLEYSCWGDGHFRLQDLALLGSGRNTPGSTYWRGNTIRLPLSEDFWFEGQPSKRCPSSYYRSLVRQVVNSITALKLNVILDLQWVDAGGRSLNGGGAWAMPDAHSLRFWYELAMTYKNYSNVLFELYNEPHPVSARCWVQGCQLQDMVYSADCHCMETLRYRAVGMQALVNVVSRSGAKNLQLVAGMDWGYSFSQFMANPVTGRNVVYDTHPYPYYAKFAGDWDTEFGFMTERYPLISAESGEYDCGTSYISQLYDYFDAHHIGWIGWAWAVGGNICGYPQLIQNYNGEPSRSMGRFIYQRLHAYK